MQYIAIRAHHSLYFVVPILLGPGPTQSNYSVPQRLHHCTTRRKTGEPGCRDFPETGGQW